MKVKRPEPEMTPEIVAEAPADDAIEPPELVTTIGRVRLESRTKVPPARVVVVLVKRLALTVVFVLIIPESLESDELAVMIRSQFVPDELISTQL